MEEKEVTHAIKTKTAPNDTPSREFDELLRSLALEAKGRERRALFTRGIRILLRAGSLQAPLLERALGARDEGEFLIFLANELSPVEDTGYPALTHAHREGGCVRAPEAAAKGDVRFFELACLEAEIKQPKTPTAQVALKDFVIPNTELIPEDVRSKVKKWSDYIDSWAVDWDFRNDTFRQGWVAYRTRKERKLPLVSDPHTYEKPGKYRILVKVIDIFGNDTSQAFDTEVK
jgi:hypothetical protein